MIVSITKMGKLEVEMGFCFSRKGGISSSDLTGLSFLCLGDSPEAMLSRWDEGGGKRGRCAKTACAKALG